YGFYLDLFLTEGAVTSVYDDSNFQSSKCNNVVDEDTLHKGVHISEQDFNRICNNDANSQKSPRDFDCQIDSIIHSTSRSESDLSHLKTEQKTSGTTKGFCKLNHKDVDLDQLDTNLPHPINLSIFDTLVDGTIIPASLHINNVATHVHEAELTTLLSVFGTIIGVEKFPNQSFAIVEFKHLSNAQSAMEALNGTIFHGFPIVITLLSSQSSGQQLTPERNSTNTPITTQGEDTFSLRHQNIPSPSPLIRQAEYESSEDESFNGFTNDDKVPMVHEQIHREQEILLSQVNINNVRIRAIEKLELPPYARKIVKFKICSLPGHNPQKQQGKIRLFIASGNLPCPQIVDGPYKMTNSRLSLILRNPSKTTRIINKN
ncbi:MAG: RNA recognition motif domain-containing protein, partial [Desulfobulbaceae bacterium]|nr:RNA recognition motif domain-containing protein [Desulfobulbaceae bacterium]